MRKKLLLILTIMMLLVITGCEKKVKDKKISVTINGTEEKVRYTGLLKDGKAKGDASCNADSGWTLNATFEKGNVLSGDITDYPLSISYGGSEIIGKYSGKIENGQISGAGKFVSDDNSFSYDGNWLNGKLSGEGQLSYEHLIVHLPDVDREGEFSGKVVDGIPNGDGMFTATNDEGEVYTYSGDWVDGIWEGVGTRRYESDDMPVEAGHFENGDFIPSPYEFIRFIGTFPDMSFTVNTKAEDFINLHENLFPAASLDGMDGLFDEDYAYEKFVKSPREYGDALIKIEDCYVQQVWEYPLLQYEHLTELYLICNEYIYTVYYPAATPGIYEGDTVTVYGLPVGQATFKTINDENFQCCVIYACYVEKQ